MVSNVRIKVAAGATVLGLGGLAGFALGSNDGQPAAAGLATAEEPNVQTEVVHRTIHVRAKDGSEEGTAGLVPSTGTSDGGSLSADESDDYAEQESDDDEQESDDDD